MADNNEILNELFWKKKKSYADQLKSTQAQYAPVSKTSDIKSFVVGNPEDGILVSDTGEVKKRIVGALGMAMGNNTIKSMASKAIKSFPIIMSDDVSPETAVMVKTMMEEQYASYIDLLVSNQIINLTDYEVGSDEGNIAIQALNKIDGTDFGKNRLYRQAQNGKLSIDDVFKNSPAWQLLRTNEELQYKSGNPIVDLLLEDAMIIPSQYEQLLIEATIYSGELSPTKDDDIKDVLQNNQTFQKKDVYLNTKTNEVFIRDANGNWTNTTDRSIRKKIEDFKKEQFNKEDPIRRVDLSIQELIQKRDKDLFNDYEFGTKRDGNKMVRSYEKLVTPATFVNSDDLEVALNRSVAEILSGKNCKNENEKKISAYLKDRFEKASYLLSVYRISGAEYISYLTDRLGIPVSEATRVSLLTKYPVSKIVFKGTKMWDKNGNPHAYRQDLEDIKHSIDNSEKYVLNEVVPKVVGISGMDVATVLASSAAGGLAGAGTMGVAALATGSAALLGAPILLPVIAAAAVAGGVGAGIVRYLQKRKMNRLLTTAIEGWERVESLIDEMDNKREDLVKKMLQSEKNHNTGDFDDMVKFAKADDRRFQDFNKKMENVLNRAHIDTALHESIKSLKGYKVLFNEEKLESRFHELELLDECIKEDNDSYAEIVRLNEAAKYIINTKKPGDIIIKQTKMKTKDIAGVVPMYGTKDAIAYGSVEYDKRDIKDRKFNEPLILTIKFKERYSDGKYADNELTAVIGILGVITRVPSEEMAYILRSNTEGKTLDNFFKGDESNNAKDLIGNVISNFMGTKYAEKLPTSGKVWANLEKVSSLAMANKLSGNNNGNISNAHLVFSQKEIDQVKSETGINYLKNAKLTAQLMKKYSAFMIMVCNDAMQYVYSFNDPDAISWEDAPYSAYMGKSNADQMLSAFTQATRMKL